MRGEIFKVAPPAHVQPAQNIGSEAGQEVIAIEYQ
jgi:hypothetical protein